MKRILFILTFFFFFFPSFCLAADKTSEELYQIYLGKYRSYQYQIEAYNTTKSRYLSYQSVTSRAEYIQQAKKILLAEVEASEAYTIFVRTRLAEATKILNYQENLYFIRLDDEQTYLSLAKEKINEASSISELMLVWQSLEGHFKEISKYGYAIKSYIEVGSLDKIFENLKITKNSVNQYLSEGSSDNAYLKAAKDSFLISEKGYLEVVALLNNAKTTHKRFVEGVDPKQNADLIRETVDETLGKMQKLSLDYQNIVFTLIGK